MKPRLLFICTGNRFRSPTAAAIAAKYGFPVRSAGLGKSIRGGRIPQSVEDKLVDMGYTLQGHRSRELTGELIEWADKVIYMQPSHRESLLERGCPERKLVALVDFAPQKISKIPDPAFGDKEMLEDVMILIENCILEMDRRGFEKSIVRDFSPSNR